MSALSGSRMPITLNGLPFEVPPRTTVAGLAELLWTGAGLWPELVVVDWKAVDRSAWDEVTLSSGASVQISGGTRRPLD